MCMYKASNFQNKGNRLKMLEIHVILKMLCKKQIKIGHTSSLCSIDQSFPNISHTEHGWGFDVIPIFSCKRINTEKKD